MIPLTIDEITNAVNGTFHGAPAALFQTVTSVITDSRLAKDGSLFVPIRGARVDGHTFIRQIAGSGAAVTFSERPLDELDIPEGFPCILVDSSVKAMQDLAAYYRQKTGVKVVGISGSVGKTSTKEMVASVLSEKFRVLKTEGNHNNAIGLPLTIFNIEAHHEIAVLEMGISDFGEMTVLAKMARPDICILTNVGDCHLEYLGDREGVCRAKSEMFAFRNTPDAPILLNGDDGILGGIEETHGTHPLFFGLEKERPGTGRNDAYVTDLINLGLEGTRCTLHIGEDTAPMHVSIPGIHAVYNALSAALCGHLLGMTLPEIVSGAEKASTIPGHGHILHTDDLTVFDDCYNANPASMRAGLNVLASTDLRRVAILGDMGELGENEKQLHYETGAYAAGKGIDLFLCAGELAKEIYRGYTENRGENKKASGSNTPDAFYFENKEDLAEALPSLLKKGDAVLVKASHFMNFTVIIDQLTHLTPSAP